MNESIYTSEGSDDSLVDLTCDTLVTKLNGEVAIKGSLRDCLAVVNEDGLCLNSYKLNDLIQEPLKPDLPKQVSTFTLGNDRVQFYVAEDSKHRVSQADSFEIPSLKPVEAKGGFDDPEIYNKEKALKPISKKRPCSKSYTSIVKKNPVLLRDFSKYRNPSKEKAEDRETIRVSNSTIYKRKQISSESKLTQVENRTNPELSRISRQTNPLDNDIVNKAESSRYHTTQTNRYCSHCEKYYLESFLFGSLLPVGSLCVSCLNQITLSTYDFFCSVNKQARDKSFYTPNAQHYKLNHKSYTPNNSIPMLTDEKIAESFSASAKGDQSLQSIKRRNVNNSIGGLNKPVTSRVRRPGKEHRLEKQSIEEEGAFEITSYVKYEPRLLNPIPSISDSRAEKHCQAQTLDKVMDSMSYDLLDSHLKERIEEASDITFMGNEEGDQSLTDLAKNFTFSRVMREKHLEEGQFKGKSLAEYFKSRRSKLVDKLDSRKIDLEEVKDKYKIRLNINPSKASPQENKSLENSGLASVRSEPSVELIDRLIKGERVKVYSFKPIDEQG